VTQTQNAQDLHLQTQRFICQFHEVEYLSGSSLPSPTEKGNIVLVMNGIV